MAERGVAIVYISHRLEEVADLCHRAVVLRDGEVVAESADVGGDLERIVTAMTPGLESMATTKSTRSTTGDVVLSVRELVVGKHGPATFDVRSGEVVGIFGLVGAGRTTIGRALTGVLQPTSGSVVINGDAVRLASPWHGFRAGVAYLSEQRKTESVLPGMAIRSNLVVRAPGDTARRGFFRSDRVRSHVMGMIDRLSISAPSDRAEIERLSGGNQQKVVLGRLLAEPLKLLVLDEPTHGIDVMAKRELLIQLRLLADSGLAVVFISSELSEVMASDRVLVMRNGRVIAEFDPDDVDRSAVVGAAAGHNT